MAWLAGCVAFDDSGPVPDLLQQLERWLEVIHVQPDRLVQVDHCLSGDLARIAVMTGETADYGTVLLLDPGLVVLTVSPGAGELDSPPRNKEYPIDMPQNNPDSIRIVFDDHCLMANAGLLLPATFVQHLGLRELVDHHFDLGSALGRANTGDKMLTLVASTLAGGD